MQFWGVSLVFNLTQPFSFLSMDTLLFYQGLVLVNLCWFSAGLCWFSAGLCWFSAGLCWFSAGLCWFSAGLCWFSFSRGTLAHLDSALRSSFTCQTPHPRPSLPRRPPDRPHPEGKLRALLFVCLSWALRSSSHSPRPRGAAPARPQPRSFSLLCCHDLPPACGPPLCLPTPLDPCRVLHWRGFRLAALDRERDVHDVSALQKVATHLLDHQEQHAAALQQQLTSTRSELADDKQTIVTLKEQLTAITSTLFDNVALQQLQEQLTSTRSELADDTEQTIPELQEKLTVLTSTLSENVELREQLTSTRCELADAVTREQVATGRLSVFVNMDKDEKILLERLATLKLELAELQTSGSQGALSTRAQITAQSYPASSPAQVLGDTPVEAAVLEMDPTKSDEAVWDFKMRLGLRIAAGPDAFFALADTKQEDKLSPQG